MLSVGLTRGWIRGVGVWNNASVFCCSFNGASTILLPGKLTWNPEISLLKRNMRGSRWVFRGVYWVFLLYFDILWFRDSPGFFIGCQSYAYVSGEHCRLKFAWTFKWVQHPFSGKLQANGAADAKRATKCTNSWHSVKSWLVHRDSYHVLS